MTMSTQTDRAVKKAEAYYDSSDADEFYFRIWGGEDIHIGLYDDGTAIQEASRRAVERMADHLGELNTSAKVLDLGAGYGGAGRYLAKRFGCHVTCLNLSETQNKRNREISAEAGLTDKVDVVYGNFESLPQQDQSFDVVWSQDALLHSGKREQVLREIARVLKPGAQLIFTDPMQAYDCPNGVLGPVLDRIHLESLGSFAFYRNELANLGFEQLACEDLTPQLGRHYARVREELEGRYDEMVKAASKAYVDRMIAGLTHWVEAENRGYLAWGILHFKKRG
jgi:sarcosine/dimethylglycine N-methyltransferase